MTNAYGPATPLPTFDNQRYLDILADRRRRDRALLGQEYDYYGAQRDSLGGDISLVDAQRRQNQARLGVIGANAGVTMASRGVNAANSRVIDLQQGYLQQQRGELALEQQQAGARQADVSLVRSARDNVADKAAVAREGLAQAERDQRIYARTGTAAPVSVDVPVGQEGTGVLGTRPSLRTQEEIVRGQVADREADRQAKVENAKLALEMANTNVTEGELMARRAGISLADARLLVDEAQTREALAGVDVENQRLDNSMTDVSLRDKSLALNQSQTLRKVLDTDLNDLKAPADEGYQLYTDPFTRERSWLTPAEADQRQYEYETSLTRNRIPQAVSLNRERQEAQTRDALTRNAMYYFDDSDFVTWLAQRNLDPGARDSWEADPAVMVRAALVAKYPGANADFINTKLLQYVRSARALQAKLQDEQSGGLQR